MFYRGLCFIISILLLNGCDFRDNTKKTLTNSQKDQEEFLFVFHAKDGYLSSEPPAPEVYTLTLYGVDKTVTFFTNRPTRRAGKISTDHFLKEWNLGKDSFKEMHPNAALVSITNRQKEDVFSDIPVMLSDPQYDQMHDRLTFTVSVIEKGNDLPKGELGEVTLFIDDICATCVGY